MGWAVTFFTDYAAATKREALVDLADLVRRIETTTGPAKAGLPWLKMARFGDVKTDKGSLRHDANMLAISGVELDYDSEIISVDEALERLGAAGILAVVYTSPSHSEDAPRWRVLAPLSAEYPPSERDRFLARLNGLLGGVASNESWTRSQSYYYGSVNNNPSHRAVALAGQPLDLIDELDMFAIRKPEKPKPNGANGAAHHGPATPPEAITDRRINGLIESLLDNIRRAPDGTKYFTLRDISFTIGGYLHLTSWSEAEAVEACVAALPGAEDWNAARRTAAAAIAAGRLKPLDLPDRPGHAPRAREPGSVYDPAPPVGEPIADVSRETPDNNTVLPGGGDEEPPDPPGDDGPTGKPVPPEIPVITCVAGELPRMARAAEAALLQAGIPIYQRTVLMKPAVLEYDAANQRKTHSAALVIITAPAMLDMLSEVANWVKWDGRAKAFVTCDPPAKVIDILLASRGKWQFPVVRGVLTCPTLRPDGSLLAEPGYDLASRYYLAFPSNLTLPEIPPAPTLVQAMESFARLNALLAGYAFVNEVSHAVALAMLMTQVLRCAMTVSPLLAVSATAPGTGKSHLVDLCSHIATGRWCPIMNAGKDDNETEKGINTKLMSGIPAFSVDNVHKRLDLEALNTATERPLLQPRQFGTLTDIEIENGVVIYMTGNNLDVIDEQIRRTMFCKMDAAMEQPEQREFKADPIATVLADRGRYIADVLIIARAYLTHLAAGGDKPAIKPFGSFPEWDRLVRHPLVWLGQDDPLLCQQGLLADDPVRVTRDAIVDAWFGAFGMGDHTLAEAANYATTPPVLHNRLHQESLDDFEERQRAHEVHKGHQEALLAALREAFPAGRDGIDTTKWSGWMRRFAGRQTGDLTFVKHEEPGTQHKGVARWKLKKAAGS